MWTLPFCSLARISPTFSSVASLPIEPTPLSFLGWHLNGVGPLPPPAATSTTARRQGPPVGRRALGTWTTTLDFVQKTLHLGATLLATQDGLIEHARDKRPGLLVLPSASCRATLQRSRPKPQQPDLFAPLYASMLQICQPRALHFTSTSSASTQRTSRYRLCTFFFVLQASPGLCPRAGILESRPWIISDKECPFAEGSIGPRAHLQKEPGRSARDLLWTTGAGPR